MSPVQLQWSSIGNRRSNWKFLLDKILLHALTMSRRLNICKWSQAAQSSFVRNHAAVAQVLFCTEPANRCLKDNPNYNRMWAFHLRYRNSLTYIMALSNMHYYKSNEKHVHSGSYLHKMLKNIFLIFMFNGLFIMKSLNKLCCCNLF